MTNPSAPSSLARPRAGLARRIAGLAADLGYITRARLSPLRLGMLPPQPDDHPSDPARPPVLLIPGVFESWHYLRAIGARLTARGHPVHRVAALGLNRQPIEQAARLLGDYVRERDLRDVVLVTHSKGGLIGKAMLLADDAAAELMKESAELLQDSPESLQAPGERRLSRLITVNTPFRGTPYARFGLGPWREFRPEAAIIRELDAQPSVNDRITSLVSAVDQYLPAGVTHLDGAENLVLDRVGHFRVLGLPDVIDEIERRVEKGGGAPGS